MAITDDTEVRQTSHDQYPPFPGDLETAPLVSISLSKLEANDEEESQAFWKACQKLGFFYLGLNGCKTGASIVSGAEQLVNIQKQFFARSQHEKEVFERERIDPFFGYRKVTFGATYDDGTPRLVETYNLRKDDFLGVRPALPCHELITSNERVFRDYASNCRQAIELMLSILEHHLQLARGALTNLHRRTQPSGDHIRFNRSAVQPFSESIAKAGEHTDFGSVTILMNWLGGLQIRLPDSEKWVYVKPRPGFAVVNLGDALVKFSAGILRSNIHRVVAPPPPQDKIDRDSLVYFARPEDRVVLKRLQGGLIDEQPIIEEEKNEPEITSEEWILRRSLGDLKGVYTRSKGLEARSFGMKS